LSIEKSLQNTAKHHNCRDYNAYRHDLVPMVSGAETSDSGLRRSAFKLVE
jgi:hypothetical protein